MATVREDMDETARLILMDGVSGLIEFSMKMQEAHPGLPTAGTTILSLYKKYCGFDGRSFPTHSIETGERLSTS